MWLVDLFSAVCSHCLSRLFHPFIGVAFQIVPMNFLTLNIHTLHTTTKRAIAFIDYGLPCV